MLVNDLAALLEGCDTVLNIGCGTAPLPLSKRPRLAVGVDAYLPSLRISRGGGMHDEFVLADLRFLPFKERSFDCVLALDVIEHLEKWEGLALLDVIERIARKQVIILTPNGFLTKGDLEDGNPLQAHHSGWHVSDFEKRGYSVVGRRGLKILRGEHAEIRWQPRIFWGLVAYLSQPFVRTRPELAFHLLARKGLMEKNRKKRSK